MFNKEIRKLFFHIEQKIKHPFAESIVRDECLLVV